MNLTTRSDGKGKLTINLENLLPIDCQGGDFYGEEVVNLCLVMFSYLIWSINEEFKSLMKEPKQAEYRIVYNQKEGHTLSRTLVNDGWVEAAQNRSWMIVCNENVNEQKSYPVRDGIIQRNNHVWRFYQHLVIILSLIIVSIYSLVKINRTNKVLSSYYEKAEQVIYLFNLSHNINMLVMGYSGNMLIVSLENRLL